MSNVFAIRTHGQAGGASRVRLGSTAEGSRQAGGDELDEVGATLEDIVEQLGVLEARVIELWRAALEQRDEPRLAELVQIGTALGVAGNALTLERLVGVPRRCIH